MGATNCPETPRQRMIGMMYLVLTAMLALNVSKDILDAFVVVDETLVTSNNNTMTTLSSDYSYLQQQEALFGKEKVGNALSQADQLKKLSDDLVNYINTTKEDLLNAADDSHLTPDGQPKTAKDIVSKDDYSKPSNFFITEGRATELKNKILAYKNQIIQFVPQANRSTYEAAIGLDVNGTYYNNDGQEESWETHNFDHVILIACYTLLNKTAGEVRNAESMVLKQIIGSIGAEDYKFDMVQGRAIPKSQMVFAGDSYEADIIVAAYDSKVAPEVYYKMGVDTLTDDQISSATRLDGEDGMAKLRLATSTVGDQKYAGVIRVKRPDGTPMSYGFSDRYTVIRPSATVAAEKMNVLYSGIDNPLSVSAPVAPEKLRLSIPGCNVTSTGGGKYNVTVPSSMINKPVTATVSAEMSGKAQTMGSTEFRVKAVPNPQAYLGANIQGGRKTKGELTSAANNFITAQMGRDFVYDLRWTIKSYQAIFTIRGVEDPPVTISGNRFSDEVIRKINSSPSGTVVTFTNIKATSTAGERVLNEITIRIR